MRHPPVCEWVIERIAIIAQITRQSAPIFIARGPETNSPPVSVLGLSQFLEAHPRYLAEHGARATLQRLLDLEATAHPDVVSPPVDILYLGPKGPVWLQRQPSCPPLPPS